MAASQSPQGDSLKSNNNIENRFNAINIITIGVGLLG
jgi:hypothetical protein